MAKAEAASPMPPHARMPSYMTAFQSSPVRIWWQEKTARLCHDQTACKMAASLCLYGRSLAGRWTNENFKLLVLKVCAMAYKRWSLTKDYEYKSWSLGRGRRNLRFHYTQLPVLSATRRSVFNSEKIKYVFKSRKIKYAKDLACKQAHLWLTRPSSEEQSDTDGKESGEELVRKWQKIKNRYSQRNSFKNVTDFWSLKRLSIECRKTKPKKSHWPITKDTDNPVNQSKV